MRLAVTKVRFHPASPGIGDAGLVGFVAFVVNDALGIDNVALRRNPAGVLRLVYPTRTDRAEREHPIVRPLDDDARRSIERQVLDALGFENREAS
jgi:hypothetical protein